MTGAERDPQTSVTMTDSVSDSEAQCLSLSWGKAARGPNWPSRLGDSFLEAKRERAKEKSDVGQPGGNTTAQAQILTSQFTAQKEKQA